jgi:hypothetical protein
MPAAQLAIDETPAKQPSRADFILACHLDLPQIRLDMVVSQICMTG